MSVTAQAGTLGFGVQAAGAKGGAVATWYRTKALMVGLGPNVQKGSAPPEVGGGTNPTGAYKTMAFYGGRVSMIPRLEGDFGWLLLGLSGACASVANATTGYTHTFSQAAANAAFIPFMGFRRIIPAKAAANDLGEIGVDCLISSATFNIGAASPVTVDLDVLGRTFTLDENPDLWTWADVAEDFDSVPVAMNGNGLILPNWAAGGGNPLPITSARVTINNNTTSPQEELIVGDYFPEDYTTRQRSMTIEATYKWANPDLYRFIINGGDVADTGFLPQIDYSDLTLEVMSPGYLDPGTVDFPWKLTFSAPRVDWAFDPVQLAGDDLLMMKVTGTAYENTTGAPEEYFTIALENAVAAYTMPT